MKEKDFIEFAKELMERRYEKGKIGFSTCKNGISYLNQFEEYLLLEHKGTHGEHKEFIYVSDISEDLLLDFRKYRLLAKRKQQQSTRLYVRFFRRVNMLVS